MTHSVDSRAPFETVTYHESTKYPYHSQSYKALHVLRELELIS
jgi:hypothetical protein